MIKINNMRIIILLLSILLLSGHSGNERIALLISPCTDKGLIINTKDEVWRVYRREVDCIGVFYTPKRDIVYQPDYFVNMLECYGVPEYYKIVVGLITKKLSAMHYGFTREGKCVVSDFLVQRQDTVPYNTAMIHIILHEVGHSLGLPHCRNTGCLMVEYDGLNRINLCDECKKLLNLYDN